MAGVERFPSSTAGAIHSTERDRAVERSPGPQLGVFQGADMSKSTTDATITAREMRGGADSS